MDVRHWVVLLACAAGCAQGLDVGKIGPGRKVEFEGADGRRSFLLHWAGEAVRVEDGSRALLATLRLREEGVAIENAQGLEVGVVVALSGEERGFRVLQSAGGSILFELRGEPDGDLKVSGASDEILYEIKKRDYGFKVVDRNGAVVARIRSRDGKISVRDASGVTYLTTRDPLRLESVAALTLDVLRFDQAAGLAVAIAEWPVFPD